jgi:hypothetical protein
LLGHLTSSDPNVLVSKLEAEETSSNVLTPSLITEESVAISECMVGLLEYETFDNFAIINTELSYYLSILVSLSSELNGTDPSECRTNGKKREKVDLRL